MSRDGWIDVATKASVGFVFFFVLQNVVLKATLETSALWGAVMGLGAGLMAWTQWRRG